MLRGRETALGGSGFCPDPPVSNRAGGADDDGGHEVAAALEALASADAGRTDPITNDRHDMDIRITKQLLSADFAWVHHDLPELPMPSGTGAGRASGPVGGDRRCPRRELIPRQ